MYTIRIIIFFLLFSFVSIFSDELKDANYYYNKTKELFKINKYDEALDIVNEGLLLFNTNLKLNSAKTLIFLTMEKYNEFFNQLNILEEIDISYIDVYVQYEMYYKIKGDFENCILNYNIVRTIVYLFKKNMKLNKDIFGDKTNDFNKSEGDIGYILISLDKKLKPILPFPEKEKHYNIIFKNFKIIDQNGTIMIMNNINDSSKYLIKSYKLLTIFLDSSRRYYQAYYKIKYK